MINVIFFKLSACLLLFFCIFFVVVDIAALMIFDGVPVNAIHFYSQ